VQRRAGLEAEAGHDRAGEVRPGGDLSHTHLTLRSDADGRAYVASGGMVAGLGKHQTEQDQGGGDDGQADHATKPLCACGPTWRAPGPP
jgi:hypothetical protein